jgi:hypothetical protein
MKYKEIEAKGKTGFLLYSSYNKSFFFRIYDDIDKNKFIDYNICAEDIEIKIIDENISLYESKDANKLEYSSKVLAK